jgi:hypothetical protein
MLGINTFCFHPFLEKGRNARGKGRFYEARGPSEKPERRPSSGWSNIEGPAGRVGASAQRGLCQRATARGDDNQVGRRDDRVLGQLPRPLGDRRYDQGSIAATVAEYAGRDQAP